MTQGVWCGGFRDACVSERLAHRSLNILLIDMLCLSVFKDP